MGHAQTGVRTHHQHHHQPTPQLHSAALEVQLWQLLLHLPQTLLWQQYTLVV